VKCVKAVQAYYHDLETGLIQFNNLGKFYHYVNGKFSGCKSTPPINNNYNVDLNDDQWLQASLPAGDGGLGIRSAEMLAPSAFLVSAASTLLLQQSILPGSI